MTTNTDPKSRLDRIARDLSRTWLHGSRPLSVAPSKPAAVLAGQQLPVDLPATRDMQFQFQAPGTPVETVVVSNSGALNSQTYMTQVLGPSKATYLSLAPDSGVPTWVFAQRQFSFSSPTHPEEEASISVTNQAVAPPVMRAIMVKHLPTAAISEASTDGLCYVTAWNRDDAGSTSIVPRAGWQPALLLRMPLTESTNVSNFPAGQTLYALGGVPQSDRFYLDQLGLLGSSVPASGLPVVARVILQLEDSHGARVELADWTIVRTNLTREARAQPVIAALRPEGLSASSPDPAFPYVASISEPLDALRLIQMGSITNSGGYLLRSPAQFPDARILVISVLLNTVPDPSSEPESAWLPIASNAIAFGVDTPLNTIRFNGLSHVEPKPFVRPGSVAFGWTRTEPADISTDTDKFGFGTISLVEYGVTDGAGNVLQDRQTSGAISPSADWTGDNFHSQANAETQSEVVGGSIRNSVAAVRLLSDHYIQHRRALSALAAPQVNATVVRLFQGSFDCSGAPDTIYSRIGDPQRSLISITPGFRDVFGNRFEAASASPIACRLFYTDALIPPSEWPGVQFGMYCTMQGPQPQLNLECSYHFLSPITDPNNPGVNPYSAAADPRYLKLNSDRRAARIQRIDDLILQLNGANRDVTLSIDASPIVAAPIQVSVAAVLQNLNQWKTLEVANTDPNAPPRILLLLSVPCSGSVSAATQFSPQLRVARSNKAFLPSVAELPSDPTLASVILGPIASAASTIRLQVGPSAAVVAPNSTSSQTEFLAVAMAFQAVLSQPLALQVGFLRDRLNVHRLYLIPNAVFPTAPDPTVYVPWAFATPRPISTTLLTEAFQAPDFSQKQGAGGWNGYPVPDEQIRVVDQDLDALGRVAFELIERQTIDPSFVALSANEPLSRRLFAARDKIAQTLATFGSTIVNPYLVPLFDAAAVSEFDADALQRAAADAFRSDLTRFYSTGTCIQLPITNASDAIATFEATVEVQTVAEVAVKPVLSDLLLHTKESRATVLYSLPPNALVSDDAGTIAALQASFSHVQLPPLPDEAPGGSGNPFSQGPWVQLAQHYVLQWKGPDQPIPVASREFPSKPVVGKTLVLTAFTDPATGQVNPPSTINKSTANALAQWGWQLAFSLPSDRDDTLSVHVEIRYNDAQGDVAPLSQSLSASVWQPRTRLQCLYVIRMLRDSWDAMDPSNRVMCLADLADATASLLVDPVTLQSLDGSPVSASDFFLMQSLKQTNPSQDTAAGGASVMKGTVAANFATDTVMDTVTLTALPDGISNSACVTGHTTVRNYRVKLSLLRNEFFWSKSSQPVRGNQAIVYECAPVESALEVWASNRWSALTYDMSGQTLQSALNDFFTGLLGGSTGSIKVQVNVQLVLSKGMQHTTNSFALFPEDFLDSLPAASLGPNGEIASVLAASVYQACQQCRGITPSKPKDVDAAAIRLAVTVSGADPQQPSGVRRLVEIAAIDFPLS